MKLSRMEPRRKSHLQTVETRMRGNGCELDPAVAEAPMAPPVLLFVPGPWTVGVPLMVSR